MIPETEVFLRNEVLNTTDDDFTETALKVFQFQYLNNETYRKYCDLLHIKPAAITSIENIPYLPIQFFKTKEIKTTLFKEDLLFESSGTTGSVNSHHFVKDKTLYEESFFKTFRQQYGHEKKYCIIGLLPSYLERKNSSLVYMVQNLITESENINSGFYLNEYEQLKKILLENEAAQQPTLLIGVTYALLDFAEKNKMALSYTTIMETGGMKGRREELSRSEVHKVLYENLGVRDIHSEYSMTELLSQAYSSVKGIFTAPSYMRILVRSDDDPFNVMQNEDFAAGITGAVNIIDLANLYSCSFIATDDMGKLYPNQSFEITGRLENSDMRGCSLMAL